MYINDIACYTNRIYGMQPHGWTINCYSGSAQIMNITQRVYDPDIAGVEQMDMTVPVQKILMGGNLFVQTPGRMYSAMGQCINEININSSTF